MALIPRVSDADWIKQSFLLNEKAITDMDMVRRTLTTAALKFTDTTIGGNFAINSPPQYTRHADIKMGGQSQLVFKRSTGEVMRSGDDTGKGQQTAYRINTASRGMGRYYSEALDDNGQYVTLRFGIPEFNSLMTFFGNFYDARAASIARTGRGPSLMYNIGSVAGTVLALPFLPFVAMGRIAKFFMQSPPSKFYYLKPAMPLYWKAVTTMLNGIGVNLGIVPSAMSPAQNKMYGNPSTIHNPNVAAQYHKWQPDVINEYGMIDPYAVATRAQRLANRYNVGVREALDQTNMFPIKTIWERIAELMQQNVQEQRSLTAYVEAYATLEGNQYNEEKKDATEQVENRSRWEWGSKFADFFEGERRDGASFVTFRVDFTNTADESFSNSTRESDLASKINSMSSANRSMRFSIADGNFGDGAVANLLEGVIGGAKDIVSGLADSLQVSGLAALAGSALVDMPKMWDASTANLPRMDFNIELRSPYGNTFSRMRNLYLPLTMLLAGALPLSTGRHAYSSPFICEAYCRGRAAIRLGMIDSISISRGTGNLGWNADDQPLGIDVRLSIVDMSSVLHMPISTYYEALEGAIATAGASIGSAVAGDAGGQAGAQAASLLTASAFDEDNSYTDYLSVLGSLSFQDMVYPTNRWRLNVANQMAEFKSWRSPARWANWTMGTLPGRMLNAISENTDRP